MAGRDSGKSVIGPSTPAPHLLSQNRSLGRPDQQKNSLKKPLLNRVQARSRHITREENKIKETWVYISTLVAVMGSTALGFGIGYSSPTQEKLSVSLNLSVSQFSFFGSLITVGAMAGAIVSGHSADYLGRKGAMYLAAIPTIGGFLLITFAESTIPLYIGRFATGVSGGIVCYAIPTYIAEIAPRHLRGTLGAMQQLSTTIGILLAYFGGLFLSWRLLAAAGMLPGLLCVVGLIFVPESPRWLAKKGRKEDLEACLQKLRGKDYDVSHELRDMQAAVESSRREPQARLSDLLKRKHVWPLFAGFTLHIFQQFTGINGVMLYSNAIFLAAAGVSSANVASLGLASLQVVMTLAAAGFMDRAGRRLLLLVSASGMALTLFLVGLSFYLRSIEDEQFLSSGMNIFIDMLALSSLLVYIAAFALGMGPIPWLLMAEIFPAKVKGIAGSLATLVNWSSAWVVTLSFNFIFQWSSAGAFWLFAAMSVLLLVFVALFVPETRGKTLEQIEESFK